MGNRLREGQARDNQRSKIYAAEHAAFDGKFPCDELHNLSVAQCQAFVDRVTHSSWWAKRYGKTCDVEVRPGKARRHASASPKLMVTWLPRWSRKPWVMLHELAHIAVDEILFNKYSGFGEIPAWHGPEFAKEYLALIKRFIGNDEAAALRAEYKSHRVKYRTSW